VKNKTRIRNVQSVYVFRKRASAAIFQSLKQLEGAHESAYLRQVLAFNTEKFRGSRDPSHASIWINVWGSCPDCPWEHLCLI